MKSLEDREADFRQIFGSITMRMNEDRKRGDKILYLDEELGKAVSDYCKTYKDEVVYK